MDTDNDHMDEKEYTCYYCQSALSYDVCLSGSHFCLQGTNAIEFWGTVVKKTSSKTIEEGQDDDEGGQDEDVVEDDSVDRSIQGISNSDIDQMVCSDSKDGACKSEDERDEIESDVKPAQWTLQFINLIKERPALYNRKLALSLRSFPVRAKCWKEIYDSLNYPIQLDALPKKFKSLRDKYNREMKKIKEGTSTPDSWVLFKYLTFLSNPDSIDGKMHESSKTDHNLLSNNDMVDSDEENQFGSIGLEEQLAELVGERPALYNSRLPRAERTAEIRVALWRQVYDALDGAIPLVDLPRKFKQLKERYLREKKKTYGSDWPLMKTLSYLSDALKLPYSSDDKKKLPNDVGSPTQGLELRMSSPLRNGFSVDDSNFDGQQFDEESSLSNSRQKRKFEDSLDNDDITSLKRMEYDNWDEDDFFGAYLVKLMKKIPIENKLTLHMDIMKMVHNSLAKSKSRDS